MEIKNEILEDYTNYCHQKLIQEFGKYNKKNYDSIYLYQRYKHRIIEQKKRNIFEASDLLIPHKYLVAYQTIKNNISNGTNLKKYQSRNLKLLDYNDDMLSHWGVQHFHLGETIDNDGYVTRTDELLFIHFTLEKAHIIGIYNHKSWCDLDIIEKLHINWPNEMTLLKSESNTRLTENDYMTLRKKHANTTVKVKDGTEYICPGLGVTMNGSPLYANINSDKIIYMIDSIFEFIRNNIQLILESDTEKRKNDILTIGIKTSYIPQNFIFKIKETEFEFRLPMIEGNLIDTTLLF